MLTITIILVFAIAILVITIAREMRRKREHHYAPRTITVTLAGKTVEVDEEGYLWNRSDWNEEVAKEMAKADNCTLTPDHWEVINFHREYYEEYQISPHLRALVKAMGMRLGAEKGNSKYLYELFPYGPAKQACKYAGLPKLCQDP